MVLVIFLKRAMEYVARKKMQVKYFDRVLHARDPCHGAKQSFSYSYPTASHLLTLVLLWTLA